jgi:hypothetical protein
LSSDIILRLSPDFILHSLILLVLILVEVLTQSFIIAGRLMELTVFVSYLTIKLFYLLLFSLHNILNLLLQISFFISHHSDLIFVFLNVCIFTLNVSFIVLNFLLEFIDLLLSDSVDDLLFPFLGKD